MENIVNLEEQAKEFVEMIVPKNAPAIQKIEIKKAYLSGMVDAINLLGNLSHTEDEAVLQDTLNSITNQAVVIIDKLSNDQYKYDYVDNQ